MLIVYIEKIKNLVVEALMHTAERIQLRCFWNVMMMFPGLFLEGFQEYRYAGEISYVILYFRLILWFIEAAGMWLNRCMSGLPCEASSLLQAEADKKLEMDGTGENMEIIVVVFFNLFF